MVFSSFLQQYYAVTSAFINAIRLQLIVMTGAKRFFLEIAYDGTPYCGWQVQPNAIAVQQVLEHALSTLLNLPTSCTGCGRTDAGVHASQFFAHFDATLPLPKNFVFRLNRFLPQEIVIKRILTGLPNDAHARFDATYRAYRYYVHFEKDPFLNRFSLLLQGKPLDRNAMQKAAALLHNYEDFGMFAKTGGSHKTTFCQLFKSELIFDDEQKRMVYHIAANRFLRGMVRRVMGALIMVGRQKISPDEFKAVMEGKASFKHNLSVPPQGLFLCKVRYDHC